MEEIVRILLVEDYPPDAELAEIEIRQAIPGSVFQVVKTKKDFLDALETFKPSIIVSDFMMPQFDGLTALKLTLEKHQDIPFLLFTGSMNEDTAVECMKLGATDYIIKEHLKRLGGSVKNALDQSKIKLKKLEAEEQIVHATKDRELLLTIANQLLLSKNKKEIYEIVFEALKSLLPDTYIVVSSNNPEENIQKVEYHHGFDPYLKWTNKMFQLNQDTIKVPIQVLSEDEVTNYNRGMVQLEPRGLYGISGKTIPKPVAGLIEKALLIKECYYIGFSADSKQLGIALILKKTKGFPSKTEVIEIILRQASQAIAKFYALDHATLNQKRLQSLLNVSQLKTDSVQELLDKALEEIITLTGSKIGYIYHYHPDKKLFILNTWSKDVMPQCKINQPKNTYELEKTGLWGEAVRQKKPIMINQFDAPNPLKKGYPEGHVELKKFLTIPVFYKDEIVAVAGVGNKETDYSESDVTQLTLMMDSVWKMVIQKEMDLKLHENEEKYEAVMNQSIDNIYIADITTLQVLEANPALCQFLGYTLEELKQKTVFQIVETTKESLQVLLQQLIHKKRLSLGERTYKKKDGTKAIVEANASIIHYQDKEVICVISHDITKRKCDELTIFESREKLRMILNYTPIGIAIFEENGFLYQSNHAFKQLFGLAIEVEALEFNLFTTVFVSETERDMLIKGEVVRLEKTITCEDLESIFKTKMNRTGTMDLEITAKAILINPNTKELEFLLQVQDITQRKKVETMKNEFINTISHEMRTPLTSIRESVTILNDHYSFNLTNDQTKLLDITIRNINRLGKLIQDVLDFQKLNTALMTFNQKQDNINDLILQLLNDLNGFMSKDDVKIVTELDKGLPPVMMDKDRISQVLINLINNALKFTKSGTITIKTHYDVPSEKVKVSVVDTGIGIDPEHLDKIFIPFFQINQHKEYKSGGTGLGLSISNKILEGHQSKLCVSSELGKGSAFYFYLSVFR